MKLNDTRAMIQKSLTERIEQQLWDEFENNPGMLQIDPFDLITVVHNASLDALNRFHRTKYSAAGSRTVAKKYGRNH